MNDINPSIEKKLEAVIKILKEQFPDLSPASISELVARTVQIDLS